MAIYFLYVFSGKKKKVKINKWKYSKLKNSSTVKEIISKMKSQPTEQEKIFAKDKSDKELISKISKVLIQVNIKTNKPD